MEITFAPRGVLQIDHCRLVYRNFSGIGTKFNREGERNFAIVVDNNPELIDALINNGWNVRIKPPRNEDEDPFVYLPVKIKFNDRGPKCILRSGDDQIILNEATVTELDFVDILDCYVDIRPYDWEVNGKQGRTAYLQSICVIQNVDRFAKMFG